MSSARSKGKQRAVDQDGDNENAGMQMDLDDEGKSDSEGGSQHAEAVDAARLGNHSMNGLQKTPEKRKLSEQHQPPPGSNELGGSISRSARMRAASMDDEEARNGSESSSNSRSSDEDGDRHGDTQDTFALSSKRAKTSKTNTTSTSSRRFVVASAGERYLRMTSRPAKTSNKRFSESRTSGKPYSQEEYLKLLSEYRSTWKGKATERKLHELEEAYDALHSQWRLELQENFTIFFYGLGSKIRLLERFAKKALRNEVRASRVVAIHGYMAELGFTDILTQLEELLLSAEELEPAQQSSARSATRLDERASLILDKLNIPSKVLSEHPIYLLVHSIDGPSMRTPRIQAFLSLLGTLPTLRVFASVDHVRAGLLFPSNPSSPSGMHRNATIYHHTPTLRPYIVETLLSGTMSTLYPPTIFMSELQALQGRSSRLAASSASRAKAATFVLASLTQKAKDAFCILANRQIPLATEVTNHQVQTTTPAYATPYTALFTLSRDRFLANNVGQLEGLLREFIDHEIVLSSNQRPVDAEDDIDAGAAEELGQKGSEWLWITIDSEDLQALVDRLAT